MTGQEGIHEQDTLAVLCFIWRINVHDGMHRLAAGGYQTGNRQLQLLISGNLLLNRQHIRFHQRVAEISHIPVGRAGAVQWIEANPPADVGLPIADSRAQIVRVLGEGGQKLPGSPAEHTAQRLPAAILVLAHIAGNVADVIFRLE